MKPQKVALFQKLIQKGKGDTVWTEKQRQQRRNDICQRWKITSLVWMRTGQVGWAYMKTAERYMAVNHTLAF